MTTQPVSQLPVKNKIEAERSIKIAPFRKNVWKTDPHKHKNYLEIVYLSAGSGIHGIDAIEYPIEPPVIHIIRQEQVHFWQLTSEPEGYVVIIRKAFIERSLDGELKALFAALSGQSCLQVRESAAIETLLGLLVRESQEEVEHRYPLIEGMLKALIAKILLVSYPAFNLPGVQADLHQSFISLLSLDHGVKKKVSHYASLLHVSPQNLNAACQRAVNQPAAEILSEFVTAESKRLLLYTNKTVSEIAFTLEFSDPSHFVKYFKKIVGTTPKLFRKEYR